MTNALYNFSVLLSYITLQLSFFYQPINKVYIIIFKTVESLNDKDTSYKNTYLNLLNISAYLSSN